MLALLRNKPQTDDSNVLHHLPQHKHCSTNISFLVIYNMH